jgi:hypothetical protein
MTSAICALAEVCPLPRLIFCVISANCPSNKVDAICHYLARRFAIIDSKARRASVSVLPLQQSCHSLESSSPSLWISSRDCCGGGAGLIWASLRALALSAKAATPITTRPATGLAMVSAASPTAATVPAASPPLFAI